MIDLTQLLVGGIPLLVVIFGLVEFIKSFGLRGNWLIGASLFLGLVTAPPTRPPRPADRPPLPAGS